ncbi:MAG: dihydrofolate reductase family protein, partial [Pricia sp.]
DIDYRIVDFSKDVAVQICKILHEENIISVLVEGGAKTLQTFIDADLWDEARIFTGTTRFSKGIKAPVLHGELVDSKCIASDSLKIHYHD